MYREGPHEIDEMSLKRVCPSNRAWKLLIHQRIFNCVCGPSLWKQPNILNIYIIYTKGFNIQIYTVSVCAVVSDTSSYKYIFVKG